MRDAYVIRLIIISIFIVLLCRMRNHDRKCHLVEIRGNMKKVLLFPVMARGMVTVSSIIICISYEVLSVVSLFLIFVMDVEKDMVCYFWSILEIFFAFLGVVCETYVDGKREDDRRKRVTYFIISAFFLICAIVILGVQIFKFIYS